MTREEAINEIKEHCYFSGLVPTAKAALDMAIKALEQQQAGHWIMIDKDLHRYKCSKCGEVIRLSDYPFSYCGCKMIESQERE